MMRRVIRDYFAAFRWHKIKEENKANSLWMIIYFTFFLPLLTIKTMRSWEGILIFDFVTFPIIFCMFAEVLHPMALPKIMYLCPMSREMRRDYIVKAVFFRIAFPLTMGVLAVVILLLSGKCDWLCGIGILLNDITFCVFLGSGINTNRYGKKDENGQKTANMDSGNGIMELVMIVTTLLICLIYSSELTSDTLLPVWGKAILIGVILFLSVPITIQYLKGWQKAVERAISYESCYMVNEKAKDR